MISDKIPLIKEFSKLYRNQLLEDVLPFWVKHSPDQKYGGYFTSLDRKGQVYDTDKFVWLQCRQVWTLARLYQDIKADPEWADLAIQGSEFLQNHGRDAEGRWYFALDRSGQPLIQPYNIFSDCFAAMAFGQLYQITRDETHKRIAVDTFHQILSRRDNPKGHYSKVYPGTRPMKSFALPMILCNLVLELESVLDSDTVEATIRDGIHQVMEVFYQPEILGGVILENVSADGKFSNTYEGRLINPGHILEAMWFVMDLAKRQNDTSLIGQAEAISLHILELGWDQEFGGIYYFMDALGHPLQQLEWDQKLWWVHLEAMVAAIKGFNLTGNQKMWEWFVKLHHYAQNHFPDPEFGEWYGYLNRRGEVLIPAKGGKWKGCFHVPRGLYQIWSTLVATNEKSGRSKL